MQPTRLRLRPGVDPRHAIKTLNRLLDEAGQIAGSVHVGSGPDALPLAEKYVDWVENVEGQLHSLTLDFGVAEALHTGRYWRIRQLHEEPVRPYYMVQAEIRQQTSWLEALRDDLRRRLARIDAGQGDPTVLDTNVLLEFVPPVDVNWKAVTGSESVRLVIPLRVVEELDVMKYDRRQQDRADRARRILPQLEAVLGNAGAPSELRPGTTIEVLIEPAPRYRPTDADEEILETCRELQQYEGRGVKLVTNDTTMLLRARGLGITAIRMPGDYTRGSTGTEPSASTSDGPGRPSRPTS